MTDRREKGRGLSSSHFEEPENFITSKGEKEKKKSAYTCRRTEKKVPFCWREK